MNCLIIDYADRQNTFFKQFFTTEELNNYAVEHGLIVKEQEK
jgi:hypothetical protein